MSDKPIVDELQFSSSDMGTPARRAPAARNGKTSKPAPPYRKGALVEPLTKVYGGIALAAFPFAPRTASAMMTEREWHSADAQPGDEPEIVTNVEAIALSWDEWAKVSPGVRRILYPLITVSAGAKVAAAHFPILLALAMEFMPGLKFSDQIENMLRRMSSPVKVPNDDE